MDTLEILKGARDLLSDVNKWAKGYYAFNAHDSERMSSKGAGVDH